MLYVLYGLNTIELDKFIDKLLSDNSIENKIIYEYDSNNIKDVIEECSYNDLFGSKKLVILDNSTFLTSKNTLDSNDFNNYINNMNPNTILILKVREEKLDERKKLVKDLKNNAIFKEFKNIDIKDIDSFIKDYLNKEGYSIDFSSIREIKSRINSYTQVLTGELDKLMIYKIDEKIISVEDVKKVISCYDESIVFEFISSILKRDKAKIFTLYNEIIEKGEEPSVIISLLESNLRLLLQIDLLRSKGCSNDEIASIVKEKPSKIYAVSQSGYNLNKNDIITLLDKLFNLDYDIKTGEVDRFKALECFFINL